MAKNKLIHCKACDAEIAASAKKCPHCGAKNKKPIYKRVWFWILIVLAIILATSGGDDSTPPPASDQTPETQQTTAAPQPDATDTTTENPVEDTTQSTTVPVKTEYQVGDTLVVGDLEIVYMSSGEYVSDNEFIQPAEGNRYIFLQFAFENTSKTSDSSISMYSFECYADGYNASMQYFDEEELSATLSAGRATSGYLYFEVPQDAQEIEVEYTDNPFINEKTTFLYEGEQDSGYVLPTNTAATEGAYQVGEVAESKQLRITYLSCFEDSSDNQFIVPKEGCRYVTCEFEFENLSNSDQSISSYSFDCYADGINCQSTYFRDDNLSATLSAGRKAKGTVTFEVPTEAAVVEVEYLSNFWTSSRVVFNAVTQ